MSGFQSCPWAQTATKRSSSRKAEPEMRNGAPFILFLFMCFMLMINMSVSPESYMPATLITILLLTTGLPLRL